MPIINSVIKGSSQGGGAIDEGTGKYTLSIVDYDGTLLKRVHLDKGASYTLPAAPVHTGLTFSSWVCDHTVTNGALTMPNRDVIAVPSYTTSSGKDEFDMVFVAATTLNMYAPSGAPIDWGDGSAAGTGAGSSSVSHSYAAGSYTIKVTPTAGTDYPSSVSLFTQSNSSPNMSCVAIRLSGIAKFNCGIWYLFSLKYITCPEEKMKFVPLASLYSIQSMVRNFTDVSGSSSLNLGGSYSSKYTMLPKGVLTVSSLMGCNVKRLYFNPEINSLGSQIFGTSAVTNPLVKGPTLDFSQHYAIPTMSQTSFQAINSTKIIVPSVLLDSWKAATNWSSLANYIVPAEDETKVTVTVSSGIENLDHVTVFLGTDSSSLTSVKTYTSSSFTENKLEIGLPLGAVARVSVFATSGHTVSSPTYKLLNPVAYTDQALDVTIT